ncbi:FHA domain-containing protein FhaB/FipA [Corynebacterium guangdongense]|uniref:PSer/pThr/pTyr-binding forkhead associated (FHA) protein n=1 Tax=Corynebacterium guangdongense TaxID=1783348 RepID=A0ABU2A0C3_9CORY|nr:FHA domain-containing protein [Corynebacterium guangdongense]MDR7330634.1 pSer/pThr/pTyr-binding forkhead associated (FHA) protein [Corynebacterium guangdongense]WJZ16650.1 FHA domain-containing protein FhaB [Corynebacterium guangdongense]
MDAFVLTALRIGLLVVLWLFIVLALNAMRRDANSAAGARRAGGKATPSPAAPAAPAAPLTREKPTRMTVVDGPLKGSYMDISSAEEIVIGRHQDCDFVLGDDYSSSRHARLFRRGSEWFVEDLESRNGTFLAGYRIDQPERVRAGVDVRMGRTTVRLVP